MKQYLMTKKKFINPQSLPRFSSICAREKQNILCVFFWKIKVIWVRLDWIMQPGQLTWLETIAEHLWSGGGTLKGLYESILLQWKCKVLRSRCERHKEGNISKWSWIATMQGNWVQQVMQVPSAFVQKWKKDFKK